MMASKRLIPKKDLRIITDADIGDHVGTRFGLAEVSPKMKQRAGYALTHYQQPDDRPPIYKLSKQLRQSAKQHKF